MVFNNFLMIYVKLNMWYGIVLLVKLDWNKRYGFIVYILFNVFEVIMSVCLLKIYYYMCLLNKIKFVLVVECDGLILGNVWRKMIDWWLIFFIIVLVSYRLVYSSLLCMGFEK